MGTPKPAAIPPGATGRAPAPTRPGTELGAADDTAQPYCVIEGVQALDRLPWGTRPPPWAPGRREETAHVERVAAYQDRTWCISEVDIFCDLSAAEMDAIAANAPMKTYPPGALLYSPHNPTETLFILKRGRVRIFRISGDGRALTTAMITPGTIFGEMVLLGQSMHDNYAEALDEAVVCVMSRAYVQQYLLSDARISARITEILGQRLREMERRLSDTVFKSVPQRIAGTLTALAGQQRRYGLTGRAIVVALTHEQIAALVGTSRETATKILGEFAEQGLIRLGRGRITLLDTDGLRDQTGD
jgi:CRP/FNR family transcriptional regulator, cyclic AMP receptor protein